MENDSAFTFLSAAVLLLPPALRMWWTDCFQTWIGFYLGHLKPELWIWLFATTWTEVAHALPSLSPGVCSNSRPLCSFAFYLSQAAGSFRVSQFFTLGGQIINSRASTSAIFLPMNIQGWFPLGLTGLISLQLRALSRVFFHVLAIINSAAMNIVVHVSFGIRVLSGYMPRNGIAGIYGNSIFSFLRNLQSGHFPQWLHQLAFQQYRRAPFSPHPLQYLLLVDFLKTSFK